MDIAGNAINAAVVATVGLILAWLAKGRFDLIDRRFDDMSARIDRIEGRIDRIEGLVHELRTDVTRLALRLESPPRAGNA